MTLIRVDTSLSRHPKVARFARTMGLSRHEAVGVLIDLWTWAVDYAEGGDLSKYSSDELVTSLGVAQSDALIQVDLIEDLEQAGFVDRAGEQVRLHDWDMHQGQLLSQREANRDRQRRYRERKRSEGTALVDNPDIPSVRVTSLAGNGATNERNERNDTKRNVQPPADDQVVLAHEDLKPITGKHVRRWQSLFPALDIQVELESMREYLATAPKGRVPKKSLPVFGINWMKRSKVRAADLQTKAQRMDIKEERKRRSQREAVAAQMAAIANTKRVTPEGMAAARETLAKSSLRS